MVERWLLSMECKWFQRNKWYHYFTRSNMASRHNITKQVRAVIIFIFHFRTSFSNISSKTGNRTYIGVGLSSQFKVVLPIVGTTEPETMPFSKIKSRLESTWPASVFIYFKLTLVLSGSIQIVATDILWIQQGFICLKFHLNICYWDDFIRKL